MEALKNNKNIKELEVLQQQVNEDNKYLIENKQKLKFNEDLSIIFENVSKKFKHKRDFIPAFYVARTYLNLFQFLYW